MTKTSIFFLFLAILVSCNKNQDRPNGSFLAGDGVFVLNEGNFMAGNGSLSFFSYDSSKIYNDLFFDVNSRPLGDVPNSMEIFGDKAYIVVNNSGKIEVIRKSNLVSVKTIAGLISPRNIGFISSAKAYVTSMYSDSLIIINLSDNTVSGYINLRRTSESIAVAGTKTFVANWVGGHEVMVIDNTTDELIDSIEVGMEPESMVYDGNNMIWVLCNGGWARENFAELDGINISANTIEKHLQFVSKEESPSCLTIDGTGETLYYLEWKEGVRKMSISAAILPSATFIPESGHNFYKLGINPANNDILITDIVDYQQNGYLLYYNSEGEMISTFQADIIPGSLCFKTASK
jgi:DNA-binding beta-propeller fold protein YncE